MDSGDNADKIETPAPAPDQLTGRARSLANLKPFVKGQPPPPGGGRPKGVGAQIRKEWSQEKIVQRYTDIANGTLKGFNANHQMEALKWLSDRGFGKAPDVTLTGELDAEGAEAAADLTTEDLADLIDGVKQTG